MESYPFVEWMDGQLQDKFGVLNNTALLAHSQERRQVIDRELSHLLFEMEQRDLTPGLK